MAISHNPVEVKIDEGILWIGGDAYPLRNIARVSSRAWIPDKGKIARQWIKRIAWVLLAMAIGFAINTFVGIIGLLGLVYTIYRMVDALNVPNLYELMIETAGNPQHALVSVDQALVVGLVAEVTKAIGNPRHELAPITVNNYTVGDNVNMFGGSNNVGISRAGS